MNKKLGLFSAVLGLALSTSANAVLIDRGNGMIYDTVQDITWMADANYARTSGYDSDGLMTWDAATTWADNLSYGGFDDWRLFNSNPGDTNCSHSFTPTGFSTQHYGRNCVENELGHLFYIDLGLSFGESILDSTYSNLNLFSNVHAWRYWSGTEFAPDSQGAWYFDTGATNSGGYNFFGSKLGEYYAWAVRDGDVAAARPAPEPVSVPASILLFGIGLLAIGASKRR